MGKYKDLTGQRFGSFTVLYRCDYSIQNSWWHCRCDCGTERDLRTYELTSGKRAHCRNCGGKKNDSR